MPVKDTVRSTAIHPNPDIVGRFVMYKSILVPIDGSELSDAAIREAAKLAKAPGSKLVLFYAVPQYQLPPLAIEEEPKRVLAYAAQNFNLAGLNVEQQFTVSNSPYKSIIEAAKVFQCELIVMASHGRHGVSGVLLGSETQKVLTHSSIPVLVVR